MRRLFLASLSALALMGTAQAAKYKNATAVFAGLDKITGRIISFEAAVDETVQFGSLQLTTRVCYTRDEESTPRTSTFVEVEEVAGENQYKRIFSGWMLAQSPGLNAIEHPVYDIWLTDCKGPDKANKIDTPPDIEEETPPPQAVELKKNPRQVQPLPGSRPPGPNAANAPLRLPGGDAALQPPANVQPRQAPQQRFFPTNAPARGGAAYDPGPKN